MTAAPGVGDDGTWLVCDYGNVLSLPQDPAGIARLAALAGYGEEEFTDRYWADREAYDRADLGVVAYWSRVLGRAPDSQLLDALIAADVASWCRLNPATLAATERAATRGFRLALLSNAPVEVARAVEQLPELSPFAPRWFSCDLRAVKPEPAVYEHVVAAVGDAVFLDDRPENVAGATAAGLRAVVFEDPAQIDQL